MASFKFLKLLAILAVMFAVLAICSPASNLNKKHDVCPPPPIMHVSGPAGRVAIKSIQNVSWWCNECSPADPVIIELIKNCKDVLFKRRGRNANSGSEDFVVDPKWATVGDKFHFRVTDPVIPVSGNSSKFIVFKIQG
ncbi:5567_t:CDS:2 [Paraglomus brasilianum]|uniref:5567_t:CDS:1 n=1 Tax=Paraglomus brasilianum TaxID=144538 RepID=A0A9N9FET9_9GLOM|nr:5567_t:CDS:2 [Paraglomus brasilianum]